MSKSQCNYCGGEVFETKRMPYLYQREGKYLLVPDMPVRICGKCGMEYYEGKALEEAERHFLAIHSHEEAPDGTVEVPIKRTYPAA